MKASWQVIAAYGDYALVAEREPPYYCIYYMSEDCDHRRFAGGPAHIYGWTYVAGYSEREAAMAAFQEYS